MWNNKIYGIEGLAHMFSSRGSILEIDKLVGKWVTNDYLKLPTAPNACRLDSKNNLIVVTSSSLLSIDSNKIIKIIIKKGIWDPYLYPRSMVIQNDIVFIGMRKGVFKFNLLTNQEQWLLPF